MDPLGFEVLGRLLPSLAVIVGALLLVRRWAARQGGGAPSGVRVVARTGVARGAVVAIVQIGSRRFLVGAGEHGVSLLSELEPAAAPGSAPGTDPGGSSPAFALPAATDPAAAHHPGPRMGLVDRLRGMTVRTHLEGPLRASRP